MQSCCSFFISLHVYVFQVAVLKDSIEAVVGVKEQARLVGRWRLNCSVKRIGTAESKL